MKCVDFYCSEIILEKHYRKSGEIPAQVRYCNSQILSAFHCREEI